MCKYSFTLFVSSAIALVLGAKIVGFFLTYSNLNVDDPMLGLVVTDGVNGVFVLAELVITFDCVPIVGMVFLNFGSLSSNFPASESTSCRPLCNADVIKSVSSVSSCIAMPCSFNKANVDAFIEFNSS